MKLGLVQYAPVWEDKKKNKDTLARQLDNKAETDLLLFPEMTLTGFTMKSDLFFEDLKGESFSFFSSLAAGKKSFICAGIIEKEESKYYNTLIVINRKGELISSYRKIHPFSYSSENLYYTRGDAPVTVDIAGWKTGLSVCYDLRFPELFRAYAKQKAELIVNIANWPDERVYHWSTLLKARAIENQCYVAAVNRTGDDPKLHYPGCSTIIDPMGNELVTAADEAGIYSAVLSLEEINSVRSKFPFLDDILLV